MTQPANGYYRDWLVISHLWKIENKEEAYTCLIFLRENYNGTACKYGAIIYHKYNSNLIRHTAFKIWMRDEAHGFHILSFWHTSFWLQETPQ